MSGAATLNASRWLNGVALETSQTLFFVGTDRRALRAALQARAWHGRIIQLSPPAFSGLDREATSLDADAERPVLVLEPDVVRQHTDAVKRAARAIGKAWFGARANQEARRQNAGRYLLNTLRNLDTIAAEADVVSLFDAFGGTPAIVVAAGPSLDRNLTEIVRHRGKALVIAVDTALRPLLSASVYPDFVVAADPTEANARHLVELPSCPSTYLVAEGSIDPEAFRHFCGRTFTFTVADHHPWPWLQTTGMARGRLRAWGSVLTTAYDFALRIGCGPIVFAGADLAFSDGRPYASGTTYDEEWRRAEAWGESLADVWATQLAQWPETSEPAVDGRAVRTAPHLRSFRDWIVESAATSGRPTINATRGGILHGTGIVQRSLDEVFSSLPAIESIGETIGNSYRASARPGPAPTLPTEDVRHAWRSFAAVSDSQIDQTRQARPCGADSASIPPAPVAPLTPEQRDERHIDELSQSLNLHMIRVTDPSTDLLAELRDASAALTSGGAIVVVDELFRSVGAQVRQAVDLLLAERRDLWVQYRRFTDRQSRTTVIRRGLEAAPPRHAADAAKWSLDHKATADSLASVIHRHFRPRSVLDVGCGAGHWITAFKALGVNDVRGVSSRDQEFLDPGDERRSDLSLCIEVAHGVPWSEQDALIQRCVRASDTVVFSSRPPGGQAGPSFERPLQHWAEKFWRHGYVVDDPLRPTLEHEFDFPRNAFDFLFVFRRLFTPAQAQDPALSVWVTGLTARLYELQMQRAWWLMQTYDVRGELVKQEAPRSPMTAWTMPVSRLLPSPNGQRVFRFRSDAARWYLSHHAAALQVLEDGVVLRAWTRWRDDLTFSSSDGSDPRVNGRRYSLVVPEHVVRAES